MTYIWVLLSLIIIFVLWSYFEQKILVISKYTVHSELIGRDINGLSFVVVSDLHNTSFGKNNKRLIKKILEQKPEFVIIAGDMINKKKRCYPGKAFDFIERISEFYPVYYAFGNHEQYFEELKNIINDAESSENRNKNYVHLYEEWNAYKKELKKLGVHLLDNSGIELHYRDSKLTITGLSVNSDFFDRKNLQKPDKDEICSLIGSRSREGYHILIAHNPLYFKEYVAWGADLVISGHMHGGLIRLPFLGGVISPQIKLFPKYDAGQHAENNCCMVISRGLGSHSFMPRFLNPPELVQVVLLNK